MNAFLRDRVIREGTSWLIGLLVLLLLLTVVPLPTDLYWLRDGWFVGVVMLVGASVAIARVSRKCGEVTRQIQAVTRDASMMAAGEFGRTIDLATIDLEELRALAQSINAIADRARADIGGMRRLERVRSEFLGNVSHELRTPIFSVQGYLETLIDGAVDDPNVRDDFLQKAHHNVLRLHALLTDLIEISRIESGEMKMSFRYFDGVEFFQSVTEELRPTAEIAGVDLSFEVSPPDAKGQVLGDRDRLKQVMVNLIENAIKYNRPSGRVTVRLQYLNGVVRVEVSDTGIGIPAGDIDRIFERFYRVDKDRSRAVGGSGLGLAIVKHIVEAHGATIAVESAPGVGSTFSFSLKR